MIFVLFLPVSIQIVRLHFLRRFPGGVQQNIERGCCLEWQQHINISQVWLFFVRAFSLLQCRMLFPLLLLQRTEAYPPDGSRNDVQHGYNLW
jgi:hypothetical protein